jgi:hypothetical protein
MRTYRPRPVPRGIARFAITMLVLHWAVMCVLMPAFVAWELWGLRAVLLSRAVAAEKRYPALAARPDRPTELFRTYDACVFLPAICLLPAWTVVGPSSWPTTSAGPGVR